jgi:CheY-like chemotaxis protein
MCRILITEDERIIAEDLKLTLQSFGHDVIEVVSTGEEAISIALQTKPDLIFMDIKLAGIITGLEAAREIAKAFLVPIIFCTAYCDAKTTLEISALNDAGYINKPFRLEEIEQAISNVVNG